MGSAVPFKQIPSNIRVPLFYAELDNSMANSASLSQRTLIIGQVTAAAITLGTVPNVPVISQGVGDAATVGGPGSMLHLMTQRYRNNDSFGEVWYLPLADDPAATAASGTLTVTQAPSANGTLYLYIAGIRIAQPVTTTQTAAQIAAALAATLSATPNLPVTVSVAGAVLTFTALNKGACGNEIDLRLNYGGSAAGESLPSGLGITLVAMTGGATNPTALPTALANLLSEPFDFIVCPFVDSTSLNALQLFLNDQIGRWAWSQQIYGHYFAAYRGTLGALTTFGITRNDQHGSVMGFNDSPTPGWLWAAEIAGAVAVSIRADPATPLQTLALATVQAPPVASRFELTDRNTLLYDGISTFTVGDDGTVRIENLITTYQKNAYGQPDDSYLEVETLFTLMYVLRYMRTAITSKFGRSKLAANGTRFAPGANVVTPNTIRVELIAQARALEWAGLLQNVDAFKAALIVEKSTSNPNRVDILWPGTLIDQLRIFAVLAQFRTQ